MGNKLSRTSSDSKFTKPTGLYPTCEWDEKTVKKLINKKKIAPRYPGREDGGPDLDECPICFLWYPGGLNRSKCCRQPICTECFLQFKKPSSHKPVQCPFCNAFNYAVKYSGSVTKEEREAIEQENQKVIEAQIRMRQEEIIRDAERQKELAAEREKRAREGPPPPPPPPHRASSPPPLPRQSSRRPDERREGDRHRGDADRQQRRSPRGSDSRHHHNPSHGHHNPQQQQQQQHSSRREERARREHDERDAERMQRSEEREERRRHRERRSQPVADETDESGLNLDIEELMVMEAIRLSLLDKSQGANGEGGAGADEEGGDDEAVAGARDGSDDSEQESGEAGAGRRLSDDEEDWPATSWDDEQAGGIDPGPRSVTPGFDAALWRVESELARDPLLLQLLSFGRRWFRPHPPSQHSPSDADRSLSSRYASQPSPARGSPAAFEPTSTLSPKSPAAMEASSTLLGEASPAAMALPLGAARDSSSDESAEAAEAEEGGAAEGEQPIERAPAEASEAVAGGERPVSGASSGWGEEVVLGEEAIQRLDPDAAAMLPDIQSPTAATRDDDDEEEKRRGDEQGGVERRAWEEAEAGAEAESEGGMEGERVNSTIESAVGELGADEEARAEGPEPAIQSVALSGEGKLEGDVSLIELGTPPPTPPRQPEHAGRGQPEHKAAARIQSFWRGRAATTAEGAEAVKAEAEAKVSAAPVEAVTEELGISG